MPWFSRRKDSKELIVLQEVKTLLLSIQQRLNIIEASTDSSSLKHDLERLIIALSSTSYLAPSRLILEEAFNSAIERAYDFVRDHGQFHAHPPIELPLGTSGSYILPLDPTYHYQLLFSNPLQPEAAATILIIPRSYVELHILPSLPNGVQRRAFNIDTNKAPSTLSEAVLMLHQKLWQTMYLVERILQTDGRVVSYYWQCSQTIHNRDLLKFPHHLCLYFEYRSEGTTLITGVEIPEQRISAGTPTEQIEGGLSTSNTPYDELPTQNPDN